MKIAVPTRGTQVDDHFGHCEMYTVFTITNNSIEKKEVLPSPQGCGCKSDIATILQQIGVTVMLAGNMGQGALNILTNQGIQVIRGCSGDVTNLTNDFITGKIKDSGTGCHQHEEGHTCNHN